MGDSHAVVSSPTKPHSLKLGHLIPPSTPIKTGKEWSWFNISVPSLKYAEKVIALLVQSYGKKQTIVYESATK